MIDLSEDRAFWLELETDQARMAAAVAALPYDQRAAWARETASLDADMASLSSALNGPGSG